MTKKDYIAFAQMFKFYQPECEADRVKGVSGVYVCPEVLGLAKETAKVFQRDNGRFDREKFLIACGVKLQDI